MEKKTSVNQEKRKKTILIFAITVVLIAIILIAAFLIIPNIMNSDPFDDGSVPPTTTAVALSPDTVAPPESTAPDTTVPPETSTADTSTDTTADDSSDTAVGTLEPIDTTPFILPDDMPQPPDLAPNDDDVKHILLVGADYVSDNGLSDIMVVASINNTEKTITCTSLMRDTYVYIPIDGGRRTKLNSAHQLGGTKLLMDTIELNFGIKLDNYMKLDFDKAVDVFDHLGGLEMRIDEAEAKFIKGCVPSSDLVFDPSKADSEGFITVHLNGAELRAHARNRSTGGGVDFNRTRRQRDILTAAFEKGKTMSNLQLLSFLAQVLPLVDTDISRMEFLGYVQHASSYSSYEFQTFRIPAPYCWKYWSYYILITDPERTINEWYDLVYN